METTAPPERGRKPGPSTPVDHWILDTLRTDPSRTWSSRDLRNRLGEDPVWTLPKISERLRVLTRRGMIQRLQSHGRGYLYRLVP